ncbi:MAG: TolC family protein, partial [Armatimonadetes bacterium]|nr:TolC family protein [Armatimonadota bacterium]
MNSKVAIAVICTLLLLNIGGAAPLPAQEEPMVLTLPDAIQIALERNYDLQIADSRTQQAKAAYGEAAAADRFQLNFEGAYLRLGPVASMTLPPELGGGAIKLGDDKAWNYGASAYKSLYSAGRNEALRALARVGSATAELNAAAARRQIALATTELFCGIVQTQGLLRVAEQNEQRADEQFQIAAARVDAGAAPQFDRLRAEVEVANAHQGVIAARTAVATAKSQLKNLLAIDVARPIEIEAPA